MLPCSVERNPTASLWFYFKVNCKQSCNVYHQIIPARANITEFCFPLKQERVFSQATFIKDYEKLQGANKQLSECSLLEISRSGVELRFCGKAQEEIATSRYLNKYMYLQKTENKRSLKIKS